MSPGATPAKAASYAVSSIIEKHRRPVEVMEAQNRLLGTGALMDIRGKM